jgi:hypothetical protein
MKFLAWLLVAASLHAQYVPSGFPHAVTSGGSTVITQVGSGSCVGSSNANNATTASQDTTTATGLDVGISYLASAGTPVVSDSKSNTWSLKSGPYTGANGNAVALYHADSPTVGTGHTFTVTLSASYPAICSMAFAGVKATSSFDVEHGATVASTSIQPGSVTPSLNGEVLISAVSFDVSSASPVVNSSFTGLITANTGGGTNFGIAMANLIQTAATSENPTWSSITISLAANIAAYKVGP